MEVHTQCIDSEDCAFEEIIVQFKVVKQTFPDKDKEKAANFHRLGPPIHKYGTSTYLYTFTHPIASQFGNIWICV